MTALPKANAVASTLCWFMGALYLLMTASLGLGFYQMKGGIPAAITLAFLIWGIAYCAAAYALRGWRWGVRWWAPAICILNLITLLLFGIRFALLAVPVDLIVIALILLSWRRPTPQPG